MKINDQQMFDVLVDNNLDLLLYIILTQDIELRESLHC